MDTLLRWLCRVPVIAAAVLILFLVGFNTTRLLLAPAPRSAWESLEVVEAWRSAHDLPVYELGPNAHATHMYGAFVPWVQGRIFQWLGPNNISGRAITMVSAMALALLIIVCCREDRSRWLLLVALAVVLGVDHRGGHYFAENRPDLSALLLAAMAIPAFYLGFERRRSLAVVLGAALLTLGFFFKQIAFVFAFAPLVALALRGRRPRAGELMLASIPILVAVAVTTSLRSLNPAVYHYMIVIPGGYSVHWDRAAKYAWEFLVDSPLFLLFLADWILDRRGRAGDGDPRARWLLALAAVMIPWSAIAHAKVGGWPNSFLPALFAIAGFCVSRLHRIAAWIDDQARPPSVRLGISALVAMLLLMTTFPRINRANPIIVPEAGLNADYGRAIVVARDLPGRVVCPEDPTIPLHAKGYAGANAFAERDARPEGGEYNSHALPPVEQELEAADSVVDLEDELHDIINKDILSRQGFERVDVPQLRSSPYRFWRRSREGRQSLTQAR